MPPDERDRVRQVRRILANPAVRPPQVLAPRRAERGPRRFAFGQPLLDAAVGAHLASREVAQPDNVPERGMPRNGAAETDFEIIRMWTEHEQIDGHGSKNLKSAV